MTRALGIVITTGRLVEYLLMNIVKLTFYFFLFLLVGCSASSVVKPGSSAHPNEDGRTGIIRYLYEGGAYLRKERRNAAYKRMFENCKGRYIIISETLKHKDGTMITEKNSSSGADSQYVYIEYKCLK